MAQETEKTSLKGMIQDIAGKGIPEVLQGIVKSADPLKIQVVNDEKLILGPNITFVPEHLTDYETEVTIAADYGWRTQQRGGGSGDPAYEAHDHDIVISRKKIKVHNALKAGDKVYLLTYNHGKQYFVLGRVV